MIGVNTAIFTNTGTSAGVGFAIPIDIVRSVVPQLIQYGKVVRPALNIQVGRCTLPLRLSFVRLHRPGERLTGRQTVADRQTDSCTQCNLVKLPIHISASRLGAIHMRSGLCWFLCLVR